MTHIVGDLTVASSSASTWQAAVELAQHLPQAALALARVFSAGGRLVVTAPGRPDHARHVAVEFIHPAITGARSLAALAVGSDELSCVLPTDALLLIETEVCQRDRVIPSCQLLLVTGDQPGPALVRWYHVLWELVQLGLEHPGITGGTASLGGDSTSFLYPFLAAAETNEPALVASMTRSAAEKAAESAELAERTIAACGETIRAVASAIAGCHESGGTVFAFGNGGSSCDAGRMVRLLRRERLRAVSLAEDPAILTALANDVGAGNIFARQVEASVRPGDVMIAFSTSGSSANLIAAFDLDIAASTVAIACSGYGGGPLSAHRHVDHRLTIDSTSVHRIQETQGAIIDKIFDLVRLKLSTADLGVRA